MTAERAITIIGTALVIAAFAFALTRPAEAQPHRTVTVHTAHGVRRCTIKPCPRAHHDYAWLIILIFVVAGAAAWIGVQGLPVL